MMVNYNPLVSPYANPYASIFGQPPKTPEQVYNDYMQMQKSNPAINSRGVFVEVKDFKEVEMYPVSTDGTPTLFFNFDQMIFWSKKFVNGKNAIQTFYFAPLNGVQEATETPSETPDTPTEPKNTDGVLEAVLDKLEKLGKDVSSLKKKVNAKPKKEAVSDGI